MFESILIRQTQPLGTTADAGLLAEALLYYKQTIVAPGPGDLATMLRVIDPDDFIGLIQDGHLTATLLEDTLGTFTSTTGGIEDHRFVAMELQGHNDRRKKYTREEKLEMALRNAIADPKQARRVTRKILGLLPHRKINALADHPSGVTGAALDDLKDGAYVNAAVQKILEIYVPEYARTIVARGDFIFSDNNFVVGHNIDLEAANREFHKHTPKEQASLSTAFILGHLLNSRGEMFLSAQYLSELVTTPIHNALIGLQFRHLLLKHERNADEIRVFEDAFLVRSQFARGNKQRGAFIFRV